MILVTVGTQIPFDRLVTAVQEWHTLHPETSVVAQVGKGGRAIPGARCSETFKKEELDELMRHSQVVVSHAGMGSIISALTFNTPIIVMPRRHDLGEHRNDHQMATANAMLRRAGVHVVWQQSELFDALDRRSELRSADTFRPFASDSLIRKLRSLVEE